MPAGTPTVALLLYRKHVITSQKYIPRLIRAFERDGLRPLPIFINGVEAHTVVRDLLTTRYEQVRGQDCVEDAKKQGCRWWCETGENRIPREATSFLMVFVCQILPLGKILSCAVDAILLSGL
jgi:hypothetical protein